MVVEDDLCDGMLIDVLFGWVLKGGVVYVVFLLWCGLLLCVWLLIDFLVEYIWKD